MTKSEKQAEAIAFIKANNCKALIEMCTGSGKSWVMGGICKIRSDRKAVAIVPTKLLRDSDLPKEFEKQDAPKLSEILCYASLHKLDDIAGPFDLHLDEGHHLTEANIIFIERNLHKVGALVIYTATMPDSKRCLVERLVGPACFKYTLSQARADGVVPPFMVYEHVVRMSRSKDILIEYTDKKTKVRKSFKTSEADSYEFAQKSFDDAKIAMSKLCSTIWNRSRTKIDWYDEKTWEKVDNDTQKLLKQRKFALDKATRNRYMAIYKSPSKLKKAQELIEEWRELGIRFIIFHQDIATLELLTPHCVHSLKKGSIDLVRQFNEGLINEIGAINMMNEGTNLVNIQRCLMAQFNSQPKDFAQRSGRTMRALEDAEIHVVVLEDTQDTKWYESALEGLGEGLDEIVVKVDRTQS